MIRKNITREWLVEQNACAKCIAWWEQHGSESVVGTLRVIHKQPEYDRWLVEKLLVNDKPVAVKLAVFSARMCLDKYTGDKTPLIDAIEAAESVIANDCDETRAEARSAEEAARSAEEAAWAAAWAAWAAWASARAAAWRTILDELIRLIEEQEDTE